MNIVKIMTMFLCISLSADLQRLDVICCALQYRYDSLVAALSLAGAVNYNVQDPSLLIKLQNTMIDFVKEADTCKPKTTDSVLAQKLFAIVMGRDENVSNIKEMQTILAQHLNPDVLYAGDETIASGEGMTALMWAVDRGHTTMARELINHGADVNKKDTNRGWTPLHFAAARGNAGIVTYLIDKRASVNAENNDKETALTLAVRNNNKAAVEILKKSGGITKEVA
jgi:hypothetical protein